MPVAKDSRFGMRMAAFAGCLLLAIFVFAWALHAKLSLYTPGVEPSNATVAKLLVPQRPEAVVAAPDVTSPPRAPWDMLLAFVAGWVALLLAGVCWVPVARTEARCTDWPSAPEIFSRPPPPALTC